MRKLEVCISKELDFLKELDTAQYTLLRAALSTKHMWLNNAALEQFWGTSSPLCWFNKKEFLCITLTVEHNYISPSITVGIQLHVSAPSTRRFRQTTRTRATAKNPTSAKTAHPVDTLLCYNILLHQWDLQRL